MVDKKSGQMTGQEATDARTFNNGLGHVWHALTGLDPERIMPQIVSTVLNEGGTRPPWKWKRKDRDFIVMAWPQDQPIRAAVLLEGPENGKLTPVSVFPLIEGLPNDLEVDGTQPFPEGFGGDVAAAMLEGKNPMWFFDPLYSREADYLTPGVTHTFWLGAVALGVRKALLDYVTITQGPQYEVWARQWLEKNPDKSRKNAPPLKIEIKDRHFIFPGRFYGEYQLRGVVEEIQETHLEKMPVKILYFSFPFESRAPLRLPVFLSAYTLGELEPVKGQELELYAWFQGRIIDLDEQSVENGNA